jgi:alpha-methylacyl-CoA racemase
MRHGPLTGVRVVEFEGVGPVPYAGMLLADMGAEVLLVRPPQPREARMPLHGRRDPLFRGRVEVVLDLKSEAGRAQLVALLPQIDILLEGYRPGVMERLGLGPEACHALAPRLIYGRMTGYGQTGPLAQMAGHDLNFIALTGALHATGYADRAPTPSLVGVGDFAGGSMFLALGVVAALWNARSTGRGQVVDACTLDGSSSLMTMVYALQAVGQWDRDRGKNVLDGSAPFGATYRTRDDGFIAVCALEPSFYAQLLEVLGLESVGLSSQWDREQWPRTQAMFAARFCERTRAEWVAAFAGKEACISPALDTVEAPYHPHNIARGTFVEGVVAEGTAPLPAAAPRFSGTPTGHANFAPEPLDALLARWTLTEARA